MEINLKIVGKKQRPEKNKRTVSHFFDPGCHDPRSVCRCSWRPPAKIRLASGRRNSPGVPRVHGGDARLSRRRRNGKIPHRSESNAQSRHRSRKKTHLDKRIRARILLLGRRHRRFDEPSGSAETKRRLASNVDRAAGKHSNVPSHQTVLKRKNTDLFQEVQTI